MSLRIFHVVFILVSIGLSVYVAAWGLREFRASHSDGALALAIVFALSGVALVAYAAHALRKWRDL